MPIKYKIDHARRLVVTTGYGTFTDSDVFGYQHEVWSRPDTIGYNELVDMTAVKHIALPSVGRIRQLAKLGAEMDAPALKSKFAIIAPDDIAFGLGRIFANHRSLDDRSTKEVGVFRTAAEAFAFLGLQNDPPALLVLPATASEPQK
jgi:hypothetical protein